MLTLAILLVALSFAGFFGINQSKNASSSASTISTTDSNNDNSAQSHNTDNSVGAGAGGNVSLSNKSNTVSGANSTVHITDGSDAALSLAKNSVDRASDEAAAAVAAATKFGADAFASQSRSIDAIGSNSSKALDTIAAAAAGAALPDQGKTRMIMYAAGGLVVLAAVYFTLKKGR